jgi:hypothetical protein
MRTGRSGASIQTMDRGKRRLTIELEGAGDQLVGRLTDEHGVTIRFRGWLGLASGLERLLESGRTSAEPAPDPTGSQPASAG